jgi:hypothetical protein
MLMKVAEVRYPNPIWVSVLIIAMSFVLVGSAGVSAYRERETLRVQEQYQRAQCDYVDRKALQNAAIYCMKQGRKPVSSQVGGRECFALECIE